MKKKGKTVETDVAEGVSDTNMLTSSIDNTSTDKDWILDFSSVVHVCSQKKMFNFLVAKEEETVKMIDGSTCKIIDILTVNIKEEMGLYVLWRRSDISWRYGTI